MVSPVKKDYVSVVYNEKDRPFTEYPDQLTKYLFQRYDMCAGKNILDLGCGRGEFLRGFVRCGLEGYGVDMSLAAEQICPDCEIKKSDLEKDPLPYESDTFDYIYSKSVIEHFYYPENLVKEIYRVLKPGGCVITMTPDWQAVYKIFFEDYTHRTPFTMRSLKEIFSIHGFKQVKVEQFRQLPFLWKAPYLDFLCTLVSLLSPDSFKSQSKLVRFSKEIMLLSTAVKSL